MGGQLDDRKEERTGNMGLAKVAAQCSEDIFEVKIATFAKPKKVMHNYRERNTK